MRPLAVRMLVRTLGTLSALLTITVTPAVAQPSGSPFVLQYRFSEGSSGDQANPTASLTRGRDGKLYGMTAAGGGAGAGSIFEFDPDGGLEAWTIHSFGNDTDAPGAQPSSGPLVQAANGSFFGTTVLGGDNGVGTLFRLDLLGAQRGVTTLFSFPASAPHPDGGVIVGSDGLLYGTATGDGAGSRGAVFRIAQDGSAFTILHAFTGAADGGEPATGVIEGLDGFLYGTTNAGTAGGTIFRVDRAGAGFEVLKSDVGPGVSNLVQGPDGMLYGASRVAGSATLGGSVFSLRPSDNQFTILHAFEAGDAGGTTPEGRLVLGTEGRLYGFLGEDVASGQPYYGAVFRAAVDGSGYGVLHLFSQADGMSPGAGLVLDDAGTLWGTTARGGTSATPEGDGVLFSLAGAAGVPVEIRDGGGRGTDTATFAGADLQVTLWLRNFTGLDAGGSVSVRVGSSLLQFVQGWSDDPDWSCTVAGSDGLCTWSGTLQSGQESAMLNLRFLTGPGPFTTSCPTSPSLGPCFYVNAAIEDQAATARFPVFVMFRDPVTGELKNTPYAGGDGAEVFGSEPATISVLDNDLVEGPFTMAIETPPVSGTATVNADNTITFTPSAPLAADDRFTYRLEYPYGAWAVGTVILTPGSVRPTLSKGRIDFGAIPVGSLVQGRVNVAKGQQGMSGNVIFEQADAAGIAAALAGTPYDPGQAVSDPSAFASYGGWQLGVGGEGPAYIDFRPSTNIGQVSVARAVFMPDPGSGLTPGSLWVVGASADPAATAPRAAEDSATTSIGTPVEIDVLANDTDTAGRGLYVSSVFYCADVEDLLFNSGTCVNPKGTIEFIRSPGFPMPVKLRFIPAAGFTGTDTFYYTMSELDACFDPLQPGCKPDSNMHFARLTVQVGAPPTHVLTISPTPAGGSVSGGGLACGNGGATCQVSVDSGTSVALTATPASGYVFTGWGGSCSGTSPSTSVLVDAAKTCSATFTASGGPVNGPPYTMTITPPTGGKIVGAGLNCGAGATQCSVTMPAAMTLGIGAVPSAGYTFGGWTGDCSGTNPSLWVALNGPRTCGATFTPPGGGGSVSLTISPAPSGGSVSGNGLGCGNGGAVCQVTFASATAATLTATPASGYVFTSWGGACAGASATTSVLVDAAKTCSATFTASGGGPVNGPPYTMTITPPTGGAIQGAGLNCGAGGTQCAVTMPARMTLGIAATPSSGYVFAGWTGDCAGATPGIFVDLAGPRICGASFTPVGGGVALTIAPAPTGGTVSGGGLACGSGGATCAVTVSSGTMVTLTATPASGYTFTNWGGACAGASATTSVLVDAAKTCSATFTASGGGPVNGPPYTMTITPPTGGAIQGAGLNCGAGATQCSVTMPAPMTLGIGATPSAGYVFGGWTGDCSGTDPSFWVSLNGPRTCGAVFTPK